MKKNYRPAAAPLVSQTSRRLMLASPSPIDTRPPPQPPQPIWAGQLSPRWDDGWLPVSLPRPN